jgi:uncharacterized membrane protein HdeD (DUF308 family)
MLTAMQRLPEPMQGVLYMFVGALVLLYALGLIKTGINFLVIAFALYLIFNGCVKAGLSRKFHKNH